MLLHCSSSAQGFVFAEIAVACFMDRLAGPEPAPDCEALHGARLLLPARKPRTLTENDLAYLRGLYRMNGDSNLEHKKIRSPIRWSGT